MRPEQAKHFRLFCSFPAREADFLLKRETHIFKCHVFLDQREGGSLFSKLFLGTGRLGFLNSTIPIIRQLH